MKIGARSLAVKILSSWHTTPAKKREFLSDICNKSIQNSPINPKDKNLVYQLCLGTVRWLYLLDWLLEKRLSKPLKKLPIKVRATLEIGLYQILFLDKIPLFAAINEAVEIVKHDKSCRWAKGLVNAVLRRCIEYKEEIKSSKPFGVEPNSIEGISILTSHPTWMVKKWVNRLGTQKTQELCNANNLIAPLSIRVNTLRCSRDELFNLLKEEGLLVKKGSLCPDALLVLNCKGNVYNLKGFKEGYFQVQDEAAQLVSYLLNPKKGQKILDACAGVGGKTTHIAQLTSDNAEILAVDKDSNKLKILKENINRLSIKSILIYTLDRFIKDYKDKKSCFDRILIDAPCSGLGVIRRHPDIKWNRTKDDIAFLSNIQFDLLCNYSQFLKKDGILVYSTCTLEPEETIEVIERFLSSSIGKNFSLFTPKIDLLKDLKLQNGMCYIYPTTSPQSCDGFFIACLKRN